MTPEQVEKLKAKYGDYLTFYPDAEFAPWDEPPKGRVFRNYKREDGTTLTGRVVQVHLREHQVGHQHKNCQTCSCVWEDSFFGWWEIESEQYKGSDGKPLIMIEYPPAWSLVKDDSTVSK